jgi:hypothetical protein
LLVSVHAETVIEEDVGRGELLDSEGEPLGRGETRSSKKSGSFPNKAAEEAFKSIGCLGEYSRGDMVLPPRELVEEEAERVDSTWDRAEVMTGCKGSKCLLWELRLFCRELS